MSFFTNINLKNHCLKKICLIAILLLGLLLKLLRWKLDPVLSRDGCFYLQIAKVWYDSGSFDCVIDTLRIGQYPHSPLYMFLIQCFMHLGFPAEIAGIGINLFLGVITPLLAYGITQEILQRSDIALCAALLTALNPSMNKLAVEAQRDMIYLFFAGSALWLFTAGVNREKWFYWLFAGIVCAFAVLTRFEAVECFPIVIAILCVLFMKNSISGKCCFFWGSIFSLSFCISILFTSSIMGTNKYLVDNYVRYFQMRTAKTLSMNTLRENCKVSSQVLHILICGNIC